MYKVFKIWAKFDLSGAAHRRVRQTMPRQIARLPKLKLYAHFVTKKNFSMRAAAFRLARLTKSRLPTVKMRSLIFGPAYRSSAARLVAYKRLLAGVDALKNGARFWRRRANGRAAHFVRYERVAAAERFLAHLAAILFYVRRARRRARRVGRADNRREASRRAAAARRPPLKGGA